MKVLTICCFLLTSSGVLAEVNCNRSELQSAVNAYTAAQTAGDRSLLPAALQTIYYEHQETIDARDSIVNESLAIEFHRSILDENSCQTFTELEAMVTDEGDWLFVDEAMGAVVGFVRFGPNLLPDTHLFRLENGKIRYVHTLTVCGETGCQFD